MRTVSSPQQIRMRKFDLFVAVRTNTYRMERNRTEIMTSVSSSVHAPLPNMQRIKTHLSVPHGGND